MTTYYCPRLPLELEDNNNKFVLIEDSLENAKQKLKTIVLTSQGEKIMDPLFGLGIKKYLFEQASGYFTEYRTANEEVKQIILKDLTSEIATDLRNQTILYCSELEIKDVSIVIDEHVMKLSIKYNFKGFVSDNLELSFAL